MIFTSYFTERHPSPHPNLHRPPPSNMPTAKRPKKAPLPTPAHPETAKTTEEPAKDDKFETPKAKKAKTTDDSENLTELTVAKREEHAEQSEKLAELQRASATPATDSSFAITTVADELRKVKEVLSCDTDADAVQESKIIGTIWETVIEHLQVFFKVYDFTVANAKSITAVFEFYAVQFLGGNEGWLSECWKDAKAKMHLSNDNRTDVQHLIVPCMRAVLAARLLGPGAEFRRTAPNQPVDTDKHEVRGVEIVDGKALVTVCSLCPGFGTVKEVVFARNVTEDQDV